jgi:UDP-N-acetylglucosamine 2-epimerase (non-hydrolysing)
VSAVAVLRVLIVAGARPNFMKVAPVMAAVEDWNRCRATEAPMRFAQVLVHTGQHYDAAMSRVFFQELELPEPAYNLDVGSGTHAAQTAAVLERMEPVLRAEQPHLVVVVGDVNSTLAATLCASKMGIPVAHVEAGLRSFDRSMPEEINRVVTDQLAELLFTSEAGADQNLRREGVADERIHFVGNTMIDSLDRLRDGVHAAQAVKEVGVEDHGYALVTLHRPSNVDGTEQLTRLVTVMSSVAERIPLLWPLHARTAARFREASSGPSAVSGVKGLTCTAALPYTQFLGLMSRARLVLTDSGGVQEETTVLGVPCLTLRTSTERPVTVTEGTNRLVDPDDEAAILMAVDEVLSAPMPEAVRPELWDGHAADRIVTVIAEWAANRL